MSGTRDKVAELMVMVAIEWIATPEFRRRWHEGFDSPTANGYDVRWVEAINAVLVDRESNVRIHDLEDYEWHRFVGPLVDYFEDRETDFR